LVKAMRQLDTEKFAKLMAYLHNPVSRRVRTNNHVKWTPKSRPPNLNFKLWSRPSSAHPEPLPAS
jgi:hypothetical protein